MNVQTRWATVYMAFALIVTGAVATYATAPATHTPEKIRELEVSPHAAASDSKKMLLFISQAERLIFEGDYTFAKMHINEAIRAAAQLPATPYAADTEFIHRVTLLRYLDGTYERQMLFAQPTEITRRLTFPPDALAVDNKKITAAEVHYISSHWDKAALLTALNKTLHAIETGKNNAVTPELHHLHRLLLQGNDRPVSDRQAAQDNVAVARALLQVNAFSAAKLALGRSDLHIRNMIVQKEASPQRFEEIALIRNEMAEVTKVIEQREPGVFKMLDAKLEEWWDALS